MIIRRLVFIFPRFLWSAADAARTLQFEGAGGADDRDSAVGLPAPYFDFGARAIALGTPLDNAPARAGNFVAPEHIDETHVEAAADKEAQAEPLRHHLGDHAHGEHPLYDDFREAEFDRFLAIGVVVLRRAGERLAHRLRHLAHRCVDRFTAALADMKDAGAGFFARPVDREAVAAAVPSCLLD